MAFHGILTGKAAAPVPGPRRTKMRVCCGIISNWALGGLGNGHRSLSLGGPIKG